MNIWNRIFMYLPSVDDIGGSVLVLGETVGAVVASSPHDIISSSDKFFPSGQFSHT